MKPSAIPQEWIVKAPRLAAITDWVNANTSLFAEIEKGYCSTDRKISGTRLIKPGKGRTGNRLKIFECEDHKWELARRPWHPNNKFPRLPLLDHNAAEPYRTNADVVSWLHNYLESNQKKLKATRTPQG